MTNAWEDLKGPPPEGKPPELVNDSVKAVNAELQVIQAQAARLRTPEQLLHAQQLKAAFRNATGPMPTAANKSFVKNGPASTPTQTTVNPSEPRPFKTDASNLPYNSKFKPLTMSEIIQANADGSLKPVPAETPKEITPFPDGLWAKHGARPAPKGFIGAWDQRFVVLSDKKPIAIAENKAIADFLCASINTYFRVIQLQREEQLKAQAASDISPESFTQPIATNDSELS